MWTETPRAPPALTEAPPAPQEAPLSVARASLLWAALLKGTPTILPKLGKRWPKQLSQTQMARRTFGDATEDYALGSICSGRPES